MAALLELDRLTSPGVVTGCVDVVGGVELESMENSSGLPSLRNASILSAVRHAPPCTIAAGGHI